MDDRTMMGQALDEARATRPHPNPRVGALVVTPRGRVLARGTHQAAGLPHAEVVALQNAGAAARGSTLYVTLEPCAHRGRTSPCVDAIVEAGIARVVAPLEDPDPRVSGRGFAALREAGVEVDVGVMAGEAEKLDPGYFHHRATGRPRVTVKVALTLDGQLAAADGSSRWITSEEARRDAHLLRAEHDAVVVGAGTVLTDDPSLTVRLDGFNGRQPLPVVIAGRRPLSAEARLFQREALVLAPRPQELPATVIAVPDESGLRVDLVAGLRCLGDHGILDALVEGGAALSRALFAAGLVDRGVFYLGAKLAGGVGTPALAGDFLTMAEAHPVEIVDVRRVGPDLRVEFVPGER